MKKALLLLSLFFTAFTASAQFPLEGTAPDFTATDINGNQHHLQEYLDDGKTVILDFFATWCPPCWGPHADHLLSNLYKAYGPEGSDEIVILAIECDATTNMDDLKGLTNMTRGDWIKDTPYPIIDDHTVRYPYGISSYPTWVKVCPDGSHAYLQGPQGNPVYPHYISQISGCDGSSLAGVSNHAEITITSVQLCESAGTEDIAFKIFNLGNNNITNFEAVLKENGAVIHSETHTDITIESFKNTSLTFEAIEFDSAKTYTLDITQLNGGAPFLDALLSKEVTITPAPTTDNSFTVLVHTDVYPNDKAFYIRYSDGSTLVYDTFTGQETIEPGTTLAYDVTVPEGVTDCFDIIVSDIYGRGWNGADAGIDIVSNGNTVLSFKPGNFNNTVLFYTHAFKTSGILGTDKNEANRFALYPNPSNGLFYLTAQEPTAVTIIDLTGKVIYTAVNIHNGEGINLTALQKGMYIAQLESAAGKSTKKIVIK